MQISVSSTLTVYYGGQFWVGIIERVEDGKFGAARLVFGAEPSDEEVLQFVVRRWAKLEFFGDKEPDRSRLAKNPKRRMREAAKALKQPPTSTKAQQVLAEQREAMKANSSHVHSQRKREEAQTRYELRTAKRRRKKRGH